MRVLPPESNGLSIFIDSEAADDEVVKLVM
jgi:hypothetical protein